MKISTGIFIFILGVIIGLPISTHFTQRQILCTFQPWDGSYKDFCSNKYMDRGDELELVNLDESRKKFYKDCKVYYIAGQIEDNDSVVFVLLKNCSHIKERLTTDIFSLRYLRKL